MIKGINKQVLEINETENDYFERAIFFVKPEYAGLSEGRLRDMAVKELAGTSAPPKNKLLGKIKRSPLTLLISGAAGMIAGIILMAIFG